MSITTKIFSDSGVSAVRTLLGMAKGILIIPLITNLLGADSYGIWTTVLAFIGLLSHSGGIHLHGSLVRFSVGDETGQTYSDILSLGIILGTGIMLVFVFVGELANLSFLSLESKSDQIFLLVAAGLLVLSNIILQININFPRSRGMVKVYELLRIVRNIGETIVLATIFFLGGTVFSGIFGLVSVGIILNFLIILGIFLIFDIPKPNISNFYKYILYGVPMVPATISNRLMSDADKYLILYIISPTSVGIYAVAHSICLSLTKFSTVLNPTLYPSVSEAWERNNIKELKNLYSLVFRYYSILAIPAFFGISYLGYEVMTVLSTRSIADQGSTLIPVLAFGFLIRGFDNPVEYILTSSKKTTRIAKATIISATVNIVLNVILITRYGIEGAAVATTLSHVLAFGLMMKYSTEEMSFHIPLYTFIRSSFAAGLMISTLILIPVELSPVLSILLYPSLGVVVYFSVLYALGEFSSNEVTKFIDSFHYN